MRPVRIEMQGFGAFREHAVADLTDVELVALVGATGSGKSTIIDAITFALYGSVARYQNATLLEPAINAQSAEARVRLEFEVGTTSYTATRAVRRARGRGGAETREVRLECGDEVLAANKREMDEAVPALLGLEFEQFNKTVVLPQGAFARFLHDKPSDRQELLRNLLGLDLYLKVGRLARSRSAALQNRATIIREEVEKAGEVTDADLAELAGRVQQLARQVDEARTATDALAAVRAELDRLEAARSALVPRLDALGSVRPAAGLARLADRMLTARSALADARNTLVAARAARDAAESAAAGAPDVGACRRVLEQLDAFDNALVVHARSAEAAAQASRAADEAATALADVRATEDALVAAVDRSVERRRAAVAARDDGPAVERITRDLDTLLRHGELAGTIAEAERALGPLLTAVADAEAARSAAQTERDEARLRLERAERSGGAASLTASLVVGESCPVCHQLVADVPAHDVAAELEVARTRVAQRDDALAAATADTQRAQLELSTTQRELARDRAAAAALAGQLADVDEASLRAAQSEAEVLAGAVVASEVGEREAREALTEHQRSSSVREIVDAHDRAQQGIARSEAAVAAAEATLRQCEVVLVGAPQRAEVDADLVTATAVADALGRAADDARDAERHLDAATETVGRVESDEAEFRRTFDAQRDGVAAYAPPPAAATLAEAWADLVAWAEAQIAQTAAELAEVDAALVAQHDSVRTLRATLDELAGGLGASGEPVDRLVAAHARAESVLEHAQARQASQAERRSEAASLDDEGLVARRLGQHLDVRGFESWLLGEAVEDLAHRATQRLLALSAQRYSLVNDGTDFRVRDHHNADQTRDAKSLSGGETFLASLSLALALADNIAELATNGAPRLGSIFLDEGFGTLDPDTLDLVAGAIEELGSQGRMVGIVTHIRDLADRMPVRLEVRAGLGGSTIERVET